MILTPEQVRTRKPYQAYGAARELWSCRDEEVLMDGPAGTGKTRAILEKIHFCCMKYPQIRCLIARKTRESMTQTVLTTFEEKVVQAGSPILKGPKRNLRQSYYYPNGSELVVGGMDNYVKVMSSEYDLMGLFEATELHLDDFEPLTTRMRNGKMPYDQIMADCNPGPPNHWLNKRPETGKMRRLLSRHEDNPVLYDMELKTWTKFGEKYLEKLNRLTGARRLRLRFGKWVAAEGVVYEGFDELLHIIPNSFYQNFKVPASWRKVRSIDFGFRNPFVCQWWALDPEDRMFLYREIYRKGVLVEDHAKEILKLSEGETYLATLADHDAEDRATLERHGVITSPAHKAIQPGIEAVSVRLRPEFDNRPRIFIMRDAIEASGRDEELAEAHQPTCTANEFDTYMYRKDREGKPIKEEPVDKDNHGMDAMRYAVCYVDNVAGMMIRVAMDSAAAVYAN